MYTNTINMHTFHRVQIVIPYINLPYIQPITNGLACRTTYDYLTIPSSYSGEARIIVYFPKDIRYCKKFTNFNWQSQIFLPINITLREFSRNIARPQNDQLQYMVLLLLYLWACKQPK